MQIRTKEVSLVLFVFCCTLLWFTFTCPPLIAPPIIRLFLSDFVYRKGLLTALWSRKAKTTSSVSSSHSPITRTCGSDTWLSTCRAPTWMSLVQWQNALCVLSLTGNNFLFHQPTNSRQAGRNNNEGDINVYGPFLRKLLRTTLFLCSLTRHPSPSSIIQP